MLNELIYNFSDQINLINNLTYSHKNSQISEFQTGITYNENQYNFSILHTYKHGEDVGDSNLVTFQASTNYFSKYNFFGNIDYDIRGKYIQNWEMGINMRKKCWNYQISYKEDITPILTSSGSNSVRRQGIYFSINFTPLGGINYKFEKETGEQQ